MTAETYYQQFAYQAVVFPSGRTYYQIGTTWDVTGTLDNGNEVVLDVYFLADGRVVAEYEELKDLGRGESEILNKTVIVTRATIDATTRAITIVTRATIDATTRAITIVGVGSGTPTTLFNQRGCAPGIAFEFSSDLRSPGLNGDAAVIQTGVTTGYVIDPDHLDDVPSATARRYFEEDLASGKIKLLRF